MNLILNKIMMSHNWDNWHWRLQNFTLFELVGLRVLSVNLTQLRILFLYSFFSLFLLCPKRRISTLMKTASYQNKHLWLRSPEVVYQSQISGTAQRVLCKQGRWSNLDVARAQLAWSRDCSCKLPTFTAWALAAQPLKSSPRRWCDVGRECDKLAAWTQCWSVC